MNMPAKGEKRASRKVIPCGRAQYQKMKKRMRRTPKFSDQVSPKVRNTASLTGLGALSATSLLATIFIILGSWLGTYLFFMRR